MSHNATPAASTSATAPMHVRSRLRRVSLPSSLPSHPVCTFRDEMGLPAMSTITAPEIYRARPRHTTGEPPPDSALFLSSPLLPSGPRKQRKKWSVEETQMLVDGCNIWGVGNWKSILNDPKLKFENRSPVDLKDRFRTYFPDAYRQHYPNAKTHLSSRVRSALPDGSPIFEKKRSNKRRPFSAVEDEALQRGFQKHGTSWSTIAKDPLLQSRRSTDLRDRFRNAFPDLYVKAGYKPRALKPKNARQATQLTPIPKTQHQAPGNELIRAIACRPVSETRSVEKCSISSDSAEDSLSGTEDGYQIQDALPTSLANETLVGQNFNWKSSFHQSSPVLESLGQCTPPESCSVASQTWDSDRHAWLPTSSSPSSSAHRSLSNVNQNNITRSYGQRQDVTSNPWVLQDWPSSNSKLGWETKGDHSWRSLDIWPFSTNAYTSVNPASSRDIGPGIGFGEAQLDTPFPGYFPSSHGYTHHRYAGDLISATGICNSNCHSSPLSSETPLRPPGLCEVERTAGVPPSMATIDDNLLNSTPLNDLDKIHPRSTRQAMVKPAPNREVRSSRDSGVVLPSVTGIGMQSNECVVQLIGPAYPQAQMATNGRTIIRSKPHPNPQHLRSLSQPPLDCRLAQHPMSLKFQSLESPSDQTAFLQTPLPEHHLPEPLSTAALDLHYHNPLPIAFSLNGTMNELAANALDLASPFGPSTKYSNTNTALKTYHPYTWLQSVSPTDLILRRGSDSRKRTSWDGMLANSSADT